ncbi:carbohydrate binding domain-containing protein [Pseudomonas grimontii]|uniref:carbohydrate binding domain-containing protein n=1 Tax=Pseudomonas grimontii TaxID=129847 RepID=UPI0028E28D71|nr:carbohydrate binding domain-containing protein [Pseudomonas grimontii]
MSRKTPKKPRAPLNDYDLGPVLISGVEPPLEGDTESDGALGARHVEHNLEVLLLTFPEIVLDTEIYLIWNNPEAPVDYLIIQPENLGNRFFSLMVDKEQILPEWAEVYCLIKRPSGNQSKTKPLKLRVKRNRPGYPDPNEFTEGNQGLVFFLPPDLEAGSHVDMARAERGVVLEIHPWENMAEWDTCRIDWGATIIEHVVKASEVRRSFEMLIPPEIIKQNPHYVNMPVAMQIKDVAGNYPADPNSKSNWSEIQRVEVNLGLLRPRPPFLKQAGETVELDELGNAAQTVQIFIDNDFFEPKDKIAFEWEGRDIQNVPFFHSEQRDVNITNFIEDFNVPNEMVKAIAGGIAIMYYNLFKARDNKWLPSRKVRIRVNGDVIEWPAPSIVEAPGGELNPNSNATMKYRAQDGWTSATKIRIVWVAHSVNFTEEFFLGPIPDNKELSFTVPSAQVRRFNTLPVDVYYERIDLLPHRSSQRLFLIVGQYARTLPPVEVDARWGNYLIPEDIGTHITVTIPPIDSLQNDVITLDWEGNNVSTRVQVTVSPTQQGKALLIPIERRFVSENLNGSVRIKYSLARVNVPRRFSPLFVLFIRPGRDHFTDFSNSNLNGWLPGPALNNMRDIQFRIYNGNTVFHNYTNTTGNKSGVIFSHTFNNLQQGHRYEFSMKARRYDGRYVRPSLSLRTSQGTLTAPTELSDLINWRTLSGIVTTSSTTLTLYINSHVVTTSGNDYEIDDIRFRRI